MSRRLVHTPIGEEGTTLEDAERGTNKKGTGIREKGDLSLSDPNSTRQLVREPASGAQEPHPKGGSSQKNCREGTRTIPVSSA